MSTPDPESLGLAAKVIGVLSAIAAPVIWIHTKLEKKADKSEVELHRQYFAKVFDKLEEHQRSDAENFKEITALMNEHHAEVLTALGNKVDR